MIRKTYTVTGTVQGVGFRPTLYRLAREADLGGWVQNRSGTVELALEGAQEAVDEFVAQLPAAIPANAAITNITLVDETPLETGTPAPFHIMESGFDAQTNITIPADLAMCPDCREEIFNPAEHRYRYPFATCTNCGPRYTVVHSMPYDRERTTLMVFGMCPVCEREYNDPGDRRFNAETIACQDCGPQLALFDSDGRPTEGDPIMRARRWLSDGRILTVRGVGGFLLAADAMNRKTLALLRERKMRPDKPFAVMAPSLDVARHFCNVSDAEAAMLTSPQAPIVILSVLESHTHDSSDLPLDLLSPDTQTLGVMLPTSPLHALLAEPSGDDPVDTFPLLVMTSGNRHSEPIAIDNDEAHLKLHDIADGFLFHNREINLRCDDSLCIEQPSGLQLWRRARGYAPNPIPIPHPLSCCVLAMGAELKNAIAIGTDDRVTLSPHIGDLSTPEARDAHERVAGELPEFLDQRPECVAVDLHPDMHCTRHGEQLADSLGIPVTSVQHHHAHAAACLVENGRNAGLALVFDGTGLGTDGNIWGAELLHVDGPKFSRLATFAPTHLPGGDKAVFEPNRQLVARWHAAGITPSPDILERCGIQEEQRAIWTQQCNQGINAPLTHAAGRLFDAFAALLGFAPSRTSYEGQAPIRLEATAIRSDSDKSLPFDRTEQDGLMSVNWSPAFAVLTDAHSESWHSADSARQAHIAIVDAAVAMVAFGLEQTGETSIALGGGVFMNRLLCSLLIPKLQALSLTVLTHSRVPPNDGGIALGQAVIAGWQN